MKYLAPDFPVIQSNYLMTGEDGTDDLLHIGDVEYVSSDASIAEPYLEGYGFKVNGTGTVTLTINIQDLAGDKTLTGTFTVSIIDSRAESTGLTFVDEDGAVNGSVDITGSGEAIGNLVSTGASLKVDEVTETSGSLTDSVAAIERQGNKIMGVFDITFVDEGGQEISIAFEDGFTMTVRLPFYDQANAGTLNDAQVYYIADDGTYTPMEAWIENGCVCFTTTHLSTYVVAQSDEQAEEPGDDQKPGDEQKPEAEADDAKDEGETLAQTGDATLLMSGLAVASSVVAFAGAAITRRR